jgi:hypothetical protein
VAEAQVESRANTRSAFGAVLVGWRSIVWVKQAQAKGTNSRESIGIIRHILQETCTPIERGVWALPA